MVADLDVTQFSGSAANDSRPPRLVKLSIVPQGEDKFSVVGARLQGHAFRPEGGTGRAYRRDRATNRQTASKYQNLGCRERDSGLRQSGAEPVS